MWLKALVFSLLYIHLTLASAVRAQEAPTLPSTPSEIAFEHALEREADAFYFEYQKYHPEVSYELWQNARRVAFLSFKRLGHLKHVMKSYGSGPAKAFLLTEVLTDFILPPIFTYLGQPWAAAAMVALPWGMVGSGIAIAWQVVQTKWVIARELNVKSLGTLDDLRRELMGYDKRHRVTALIYEELRSELGIEALEVVKKYRALTAGPVVTVRELEAIILVQGRAGKDFLTSLHLERAKPDLFSAKLVRYILGEQALMDRLVSLVSKRIQEPISETRESLAEMDRQVQEIEFLKEQEAERLSQIKKRYKAKEIPRSEYKNAKRDTASRTDSLDAMKLRITKAEYMLLENHRKLTVEASKARVRPVVSGAGGSCQGLVLAFPF